MKVRHYLVAVVAVALLLGPVVPAYSQVKVTGTVSCGEWTKRIGEAINDCALTWDRASYPAITITKIPSCNDGTPNPVIVGANRVEATGACNVDGEFEAVSDGSPSVSLVIGSIDCRSWTKGSIYGNECYLAWDRATYPGIIIFDMPRCDPLTHNGQPNPLQISSGSVVAVGSCNPLGTFYAVSDGTASVPIVKGSMNCGSGPVSGGIRQCELNWDKRQYPGIAIYELPAACTDQPDGPNPRVFGHPPNWVEAVGSCNVSGEFKAVADETRAPVCCIAGGRGITMKIHGSDARACTFFANSLGLGPPTVLKGPC